MSKRRLLGVAAVLALLAAAATVAWAQEAATASPASAGLERAALDGYMTVTGSRQGEFAGSGRGGRIEIIAANHEIVAPHDPASGLPTGKRQHQPFVITKELDKSTPLLLNALFTNENLSVTVFVNDGPSNTIARIELTNATLVGRSQGPGPTEIVSFTYQTIAWTWVDGGTTAEDDWETPVA